MGVINVELEEFVKINKRKVVQARQIIQQLLAHVDMEDIKGIWESAINVVSAAITVINQRSVIGAILDTIWIMVFVTNAFIHVLLVLQWPNAFHTWQILNMNNQKFGSMWSSALLE